MSSMIWQLRGSIGVKLHEKHKCINLRNLMQIIPFGILILFSALRDGIGIDYVVYIEQFYIINNDYPSYMEPGFKLLIHIVSLLSNNPRWVVIIMGLFTCVFYFIAIAKMSKNPPLALFIFMTWGYYFFTFNTVRNFFAYSLVLVSIIFLAKGKFFKVVFIILLASMFHKSALTCIPLYLLSKFDFARKYLLLIIFGVMGGLLFQNEIRELFFIFYGGYEGSAYDTSRISYMNIVKELAILGMAVLFYKHVKNDEVNRICFNLNVFALIFYVGFYYTPEISRIGYYMNSTCIILIPRLLAEINNQKTRMILTSFLFLGSCVAFYLLMRGWYSETILLLPYKTWL